MKTPGLSPKELRGEEADALRAVFLLKREVERSYHKDRAGEDYCNKLLNTISRFLDHIDGPLSLAGEIELFLSFAGVNNYTRATIKKRIEDLKFLDEMLEKEGYPLEPSARTIPFIERRKKQQA